MQCGDSAEWFTPESQGAYICAKFHCFTASLRPVMAAHAVSWYHHRYYIHMGHLNLGLIFVGHVTAQ